MASTASSSVARLALGVFLAVEAVGGFAAALEHCVQARQLAALCLQCGLAFGHDTLRRGNRLLGLADPAFEPGSGTRRIADRPAP